MLSAHAFNGSYTGDHLNHVMFPLGGIGAGMIGLEGVGGFVDLSIHHHPQIFTKPFMFAALHVNGMPNASRVLEGPFPAWGVFGPSGGQNYHSSTGTGMSGKNYGFPRFDTASCLPRFPFSTIDLAHPAIPLTTELTGWSPFVPGDADNSSLPVAAVEYRFTNPTDQPVTAVFSFHAKNMLAQKKGVNGVGRVDGGFMLWENGTEEEPWRQSALIAAVDEKTVGVDCQWFRGKWYDAPTMLWKRIASGVVRDTAPYAEGDPSTGGSLYVPFTLQPGEEKTIRVRLSWHVPTSTLRTGKDKVACECSGGTGCCGEAAKTDAPTYRPWYAGRFENAQAVDAYWKAQYDTLRAQSALFRDTFYDSTLPAEVQEAVSANLSILKSPTILRQEDGRLWCYEGCSEVVGCCAGSCTHVWNYAQALPHLFPELERGLRETEFFDDQDTNGHQTFRAWLPIRPITDHSFYAAADGQLGGIMKVFRDWQISGDSAWLRRLWPQVRQSLCYCIDTWDPEHKGAIEEPHHNTYDIEFWGADGMCTSVYLGALVAAVRMAEALGEDAEPFATLAGRARHYLETDLYNGEYFIQQIKWEGLRARSPLEVDNISYGGSYSPEAAELLQQEGPKYQYGHGCLSDGVIGAWFAEVCGVGAILDAEKVTAHLTAVHRHNLKRDLSDHANPERPGYALGHEGGLLLCTWPKGDALTLPFVYADEVWTGIEYQVAAHLIAQGKLDEGLDIVRVARQRYDGRVRNPFNEYECGHWYARALSSYALLQAFSGARYDAVEQVLYLAPRIAGDFRAFLCTDGGYGVVGVRNGEPFLEVRAGDIPLTRIVYVAR